MPPFPRPATYRAGRLAWPVTVLRERSMFGRHEYEIQARDRPESDTTWIVANSKYLTFDNQEEAQP